MWWGGTVANTRGAGPEVEEAAPAAPPRPAVARPSSGRRCAPRSSPRYRRTRSAGPRAKRGEASGAALVPSSPRTSSHRCRRHHGRRRRGGRRRGRAPHKARRWFPRAVGGGGHVAKAPDGEQRHGSSDSGRRRPPSIPRVQRATRAARHDGPQPAARGPRPRRRETLARRVASHRGRRAFGVALQRRQNGAVVPHRVSTGRRARAAARFAARGQVLLDGRHDIANGPDRLQRLFRQATSRPRLQLHGHIDGVDAVEIEVLKSRASGVIRAGSMLNRCASSPLTRA